LWAGTSTDPAIPEQPLLDEADVTEASTGVVRSHCVLWRILRRECQPGRRAPNHMSVAAPTALGSAHDTTRVSNVPG